MRTCPDCLSDYKHSRIGKLARKTAGAWGRGLWPESIYHDEKTSKCRTHHAQSLADSAARRASEMQAMPVWADKQAIKSIYQQCVEVSLKTGVPHHVDHIVPLRGKLVSGLHVHWNMQLLPAKENTAKSNQFAI